MAGRRGKRPPQQAAPTSESKLFNVMETLKRNLDEFNKSLGELPKLPDDFLNHYKAIKDQYTNRKIVAKRHIARMIAAIENYRTENKVENPTLSAISNNLREALNLVEEIAQQKGISFLAATGKKSEVVEEVEKGTLEIKEKLAVLGNQSSSEANKKRLDALQVVMRNLNVLLMAEEISPPKGFTSQGQLVANWLRSGFKLDDPDKLIRNYLQGLDDLKAQETVQSNALLKEQIQMVEDLILTLYAPICEENFSNWMDMMFTGYFKDNPKPELFDENVKSHGTNLIMKPPTEGYLEIKRVGSADQLIDMYPHKVHISLDYVSNDNYLKAVDFLMRTVEKEDTLVGGKIIDPIKVRRLQTDKGSRIDPGKGVTLYFASLNEMRKKYPTLNEAELAEKQKATLVNIQLLCDNMNIQPLQVPTDAANPASPKKAAKPNKEYPVTDIGIPSEMIWITPATHTEEGKGILANQREFRPFDPPFATAFQKALIRLHHEDTLNKLTPDELRELQSNLNDIANSHRDDFTPSIVKLFPELGLKTCEAKTLLERNAAENGYNKIKAYSKKGAPLTVEKPVAEKPVGYKHTRKRRKF